MAKKMTDKDFLAFARNELERSKNWRSSRSGFGFDEQWRRYIDLYSGRHWDSKSGTDQLIVNLIFSTINVMAPAVAINNPRFVVNARKPEQAPQAIVTEEVLNYAWRKNEFQRDFRLAVLDWLITGQGWLKIGYKSTKKPQRKGTDGVAPHNSDAGSGSEGGEEGIDDREDVEGNVESELNVDPGDDRPFVERLSVFDIYVDPDARHPKEMRWIAQRTWRPVADVQVDSRYSPTQRTRVSGSHWSPWSTESGDGRADSDGSEKPNKGALTYAEVIEFYDIKRNTVSTFAIDADGEAGDEPDAGFLIKPADIPYASGHPFVMLRNYEVPDHFYCMGDVQQIESLQLELNETRTQMLNYRKKFRRAWTYRKDAFDREGIQALESDEDNVMIPVQSDEALSGVLQPVPAIISPAEFFDQSAMIQNDMDMVSGVSDYAKGNPQSTTRRTATEAAMIADAANARAQDRLMKIELVLSECGQRVIQLMQQYMTGEQVARVVTLPVTGWVNYDKDYIQGEFDYEVRGGSTEPQNETFRRQSALQLADVSAQFVDMGVADPVALYQKLLRDGFGEKDTERFILQQAPPQEEQQQQMPPEQGMPPEMGMGGPPPPQGGLQMQQPMDPNLGPSAQELTPEMLAMMMAEGAGMDPSMAPPPEMMNVPPPWA
jgi:hypothetical protein